MTTHHLLAVMACAALLTLVQLLTTAGWQAIAADISEGSTALSCEGESVDGACRLPAGPPMCTDVHLPHRTQWVDCST